MRSDFQNIRLMACGLLLAAISASSLSYQRTLEIHSKDSITIFGAFARKTLYSPSRSEVLGYYWGIYDLPECVRIAPDTTLITYRFNVYYGDYEDSTTERHFRLSGPFLLDTTVYEAPDSSRIEELQGKPTPAFPGWQYEFHKVDSTIFLILRADTLQFADFILSNGHIDPFNIITVYRKLDPNAPQLQRLYKQQAQHHQGAFMDSFALPAIMILLYLAVIVYVLFLLTRLVKAVERISDKLTQ